MQDMGSGDEPTRATTQAGESTATARGLRRWLLCGVQAGKNPAQPFGGAILWMNWQRRGDFQALVRSAHEGAAADAGFDPVRLVDAFFVTPWLGVDVFVVAERRDPKAPDIDAESADASADFVRDKQIALADFMANQIDARLRAEPDEPQPFRIWVDARAAGYAGRGAAVADIENRVLRSVFGRLRAGDMVTTHRIETTPALILADALLRAVLAGWQGGPTRAPVKAVQDRIAASLGWTDVRTVSRPEDTKFNVQLGRPRERPKLPAQLGLFDQPRSSRRRAPM